MSLVTGGGDSRQCSWGTAACWHTLSIQPPLIYSPDRIPVKPHLVYIFKRSTTRDDVTTSILSSRRGQGVCLRKTPYRDAGAPVALQAHILPRQTVYPLGGVLGIVFEHAHRQTPWTVNYYTNWGVFVVPFSRR